MKSRNHAQAQIAGELPAIVLFITLSIIFFMRALQAAQNTLWFDEVLAVWTARRPNAAAVWFALEQGSDFTPPLYSLFLHAIVEAGFTSPTAMRLPSIIAVYVAALAIAAFVRRRASLSVAVFTAGIVLTSGMFEYGVQARSYALLTAVIAIATVVWDRLSAEQPSKQLVFFFGLLLILAMGLHYYAVVPLAMFGLAELCWSAVHRQLRFGVWVALGTAMASMLVWLPLIKNTAQLLAADRDAVGYYGQPRAVSGRRESKGIHTGVLI